MKQNTNIYSLNVNQFNGTTSWRGLTEEQAINLWLQNKDYIFTKIRSWLLNDDNIVFLHEVPNNYGKNKTIYDCFVHECKLNNWNLAECDYSESYFKTVAVFKNNCNYQNIELPGGEKSNRVLMMKHNIKNILFVGIHIPSNDADESWKICMDQLINIYNKYNNDYSIVYIGDTNIDLNYYNKEKYNNQSYMPRYEKFNEFINSCKLYDAWLKKNSCLKSNIINNLLFDGIDEISDEDNKQIKSILTKYDKDYNIENAISNISSYFNKEITIQDTFIGHTRIDKVLLKKEILPEYYDIIYDDNVRYSQHSDHSAICLAILDGKFYNL